jgi:phenylalanyl-tRNA synthetase beta chain
MECMHYSFVSDDLLDVFNKDDRKSRLVLPNPVNADQGVMRNSLIPQMVESLGRNYSRQITDAAMFEFGRIYWQEPDGSNHEDFRVSIGIMGKAGRDGLSKRKPITGEEVFFWAKGIIESMAKNQHLPKLEFIGAEHPYCEKGEAAEICMAGKKIGFVGLLRDNLRHRHRMAEPVAIAEIQLADILDRTFTPPIFKPVPQYPAISRDMAIIVDKSVSHGAILKIIQNVAPPELTGVDLFDIFEGAGVEKGRKSLAYSLMYRSFERTLTDEDANRYHESIKSALKSELGVEIREG